MSQLKKSFFFADKEIRQLLAKEANMLVHNFYQVSAKSHDEIRSELKPDIRALKINPDGRENKRHNPGNNNPGEKKDRGKKRSDHDPESSKLQNDPWEVYNSKGRVARIKIRG